VLRIKADNPHQKRPSMKTRTQPFEDRADAAHCLVEILADLAKTPWPAREAAGMVRQPTDTMILGLTRGGVPLAQILSLQLNLPFDLLVVRKLPVPGNPELAMGAIAEYGAEFLNEDVLRWVVDADEALAVSCAREQEELQRRVRLYRAGRKKQTIAAKHVVLVDDGAATGATMRAAIAATRNAGAARVTVALPVAPKETCGELAAEADEVRCLWQPDWFQSVGACYRHFPQVSDAQVLEALGPPPARPVAIHAPNRIPQVQHALPFSP
jgi:putative phosphoribosyl transferase